MLAKLHEWLEKQGYPLEMKVAKELLKNNFNTLQSNYYKDPETDKSREIDVVGQFGYAHKGYTVLFQLIIECKNNTSKPWITFSSENHTIKDNDFLIQRPASNNGSKYLKFISEKKLLERTDFFNKPKSFAYNITQAFETESDKTYSALMSVINAVKFRKDKTNHSFSHTKSCEIYYPLIVLGGKLFDCYLDGKGESKIDEVENKILLWRNSQVGYNNTIIEIMTFESFSKRIVVLKKELEELMTIKSTDFFDGDYYNS